MPCMFLLHRSLAKLVVVFVGVVPLYCKRCPFTVQDFSKVSASPVCMVDTVDVD